MTCDYEAFKASVQKRFPTVTDDEARILDEASKLDLGDDAIPDDWDNWIADRTGWQTRATQFRGMPSTAERDVARYVAPEGFEVKYTKVHPHGADMTMGYSGVVFLAPKSTA